jgi:hypothetical protein
MALRCSEDNKAVFSQTFSDVEKSNDNPWYMLSNGLTCSIIIEAKQSQLLL